MASFKIHSLSELNQQELYEILALRAEVFIVEQKCAYQDLDGKDVNSLHARLIENNKLCAYCRIIPPDVIFKEISIGRVLTPLKYRSLGHGKEIMEKSKALCFELYPNKDILIMAQSYLVNFYEQLGFKIEKDEFLEDGIPHRWMRLNARVPNQ